jgi:ATP-dependent Clp protease adapter protein ClpS
MNYSIFKPDSFVKFKKINFNVLYNETNLTEKNEIDLTLKNKNLFKNNKNNNDNLNKQEFVLNVLEELRNFDNKNGTELFKNILYNDLKKFIYANKF